MSDLNLKKNRPGTSLSLNESSLNDCEGCLERMKASTGVNSNMDLARILNIQSQSIASAKRRGQIPPGWVYEIALKYNISTDWLFFGIGSKERGGTPHEPQSNVVSCADNTAIDIDNYCFVPMVECRLSGGNGAVVYSEGIKDYYAFRRRYINYIATSPKNLVLMRVSGNSMEPEIKDGGTVLIDMGRKHPKGGCYFALGFGDAIMVKEIELLPADRVRIISKNKADYQPYDADLKDIRIIGQVIWGDRTFPI